MTEVFKPKFNAFFTYERMTKTLKTWAKNHPKCCKLHQLGETHQKRVIWALEISNFDMGNVNQKPGYYIEACIHAEEVMGTNVSMYIAWYLLEHYGKDTWITDLMDCQVFYLIPRVNPDGVSFVLQQGHPWCGNGRYLPGEEQTAPGMFWKDLNGDGIIAQMRLKDPNGEWKVSEVDERIMVLREPWERQGTFYRLLPEGEIRDYDDQLLFPKPQDGNLNRNFPANYFPEGRQYGAGDFPFQEPESYAIGQFILAHPNIAGVMSYHTNAGAILRPFADKSDEYYKGNDLKLYKTLGKMGTKATGYPLISVFEDFTTRKDSVRGGTLTDWTYEFLGLPSFVTELWNINTAAGVPQEGMYPSMPQEAEDLLKILRFEEPFLGEQAYLRWEPYQHPQLGEVEIGGWNRIWVFRNAPEAMLEKIASEQSRYCLQLAATLPGLQINNMVAEEIEPGIIRLSAQISNRGFLPTYLTDQAKYMKKDKTIRVMITAQGPFELLSGKSEENIGHLEGRLLRDATWSQWGPIWEPASKKVTWIVRVIEPTTFIITAQSDKAGVCQQALTL